jgi:hypothetical protein
VPTLPEGFAGQSPDIEVGFTLSEAPECGFYPIEFRSCTQPAQVACYPRGEEDPVRSPTSTLAADLVDHRGGEPSAAGGEVGVAVRRAATHSGAVASTKSSGPSDESGSLWA